MATASITKVKEFQSSLGQPLATPDGTSIEELVNAFLATLPQTKIQDVIRATTSTGKYGANVTYFATVVYST